MSRELVEVDVVVLAETELAFLVSDGIVEEWVPKSQIEDDGLYIGYEGTIEIPEWLAVDKGLV